jgi:hypothetical protein
MMVVWIATTIYGGIIIFRALSPELARIQARVYLQPELAINLAKQERFLITGGAAAIILWAVLLAFTVWNIMIESPTVCQLYLC